MNKSWEYKKIGDVCVVERGGSPRPIDKFITDDEDGINWIKIGDTSDSMYITETAQRIIPEGMKKSRYVKPGDFLLSNSMSFGRPYILKIDGCIHDGWLVLRDEKELFDKRFLYYYLSSKTTYEKFKSMAVGGVVNNLNSEMVRNVSVPVPSKEEQAEIADLLDRLKVVLDRRKQELQLLDNLIKARFVELFGIPIDNTKNWPMDKAVNLCTLVTDGSHFSPKACDEGYPMLSVKDMRQNGFDYSDCKLVDDETFEILKKQGCVPQVDDVLIAKDGSYFTRAFAITEYKEQAILSSIGMYRPDIDRILPRFLASYLMTNEVIEFVNRGYVTGTALRRVIIKGLKNIPVYMPPLELQKEFVQFAEQVDKSKVAVQNALDETQLLFDSLMQQYFG